MLDDDGRLRDTLFEQINIVKRTAFVKEKIDDDTYLGGDLGIESIEMLEIWFLIERELGIKIIDESKRDIYTIGQVVGVLKNNCNNK